MAEGVAANISPSKARASAAGKASVAPEPMTWTKDLSPPDAAEKAAVGGDAVHVVRIGEDEEAPWRLRFRRGTANRWCGGRIGGRITGDGFSTTFASICSGLICGLIFFVFCAVFSSMIFGRYAKLTSAISLGISLQTLCVLIASFAFARFSGYKAVMAGPDINPTVFMAEAASLIASFDSINDEKTAVATVLVSTVIATLLIALSFTALGVFKLTGIVGYIPANVVSGFLACIGWKVLKSSIEVACPISADKKFKSDYLNNYFGSWEESWMYYLPALGIGLCLFFLKRWHIGKPTINFPVFIIGPVALFYIIVYGMGKDVYEMRDEQWLYPKAEHTDFWEGWQELYGGLFGGKVLWEALPQCIPVWTVMVLIICLDNLLNELASTEKALGIDLDYNHEMKVGGWASVATGLLGGNVVYGQTKFNAISYSITHSTETRLPAIVCGAFSGVLFFSGAGAPLINFLPRFLLAGLLVFAAVGFFLENLWDARLTFNRLEYIAIWVIFGVFLVTSELIPEYSQVIAIIVGLVWAAVAFAIHFTHKTNQYDVSEISISGANHCSTAVRSATQEMKLGIIGVWYHIFKLSDTSGYIFFGTASRLYTLFKQHVAGSKQRPIAQRTKYAILDMTNIYGIDATAGSVFSKMQRLARKEGIELIWAGIHANVAKRIRGSGIKLKAEFVHPTFDAAEKNVEDLLLAHVHKLAQHWLIDKTARNIYNIAMLHDALTSTHDVFDGRSLTHSICPSQLIRWATKVMVKQGEHVYNAGELDDGLYLLYRGQVRIEEEDEGTSTIYPGAFFNEHVVYAHPKSLSPSTAIATQDSVMLKMSQEQRDEMHWHDPHAAFELVVAIFKQVEMRSPRRRHLHRASHLHQASMARTYAREPVPEDEPSTVTAPLVLKQSSLHSMHRAHRSASMNTLSAKDKTFREVLQQALNSAQQCGQSIRDSSASGYRCKLEGSDRSPQAPLVRRGRSHGRDSRVVPMDDTHLSIPEVPLVRRGQSHNVEDTHPSIPEIPLVRRGRSHNAETVRRDGSCGSPPRVDRTPSTEAVLYRAGSSAAAPPPDSTIDADFIHGNDHRVELPEAMAAHYKHIFELNDHAGRGHLKVDELSKFMSLTGHGLSVSELEEMMHEVGIDEDKDECITEEDFLEFIRRTLLTDLPSSKVPSIHLIFEELASQGDEHAMMPSGQHVRPPRAAKAMGYTSKPASPRESPSDGITKRQLEILFGRLGINAEGTDMTEVFDEVDVDGDGIISFPECLAAIAILKRNVVEVYQLEASFTRFRHEARSDALPAEVGSDDEQHLVRVSDLMKCLDVTRQEAEEMMFIADMNESATVGFTEFKQVVVNWS